MASMIFNSFSPSDKNFQAILMPTVILAEVLSQKNWSPGTILTLRSLINVQCTVVGLLRERVTKLFQQIEMNETLVFSLKY